MARTAGARSSPVSVGDPLPPDADILLGGGGQDAAQGEIGADFASRGPQLRAMADDGVVMLTICGSYQMLGHEFVTQDGRHIPGVGVLDVVTARSGRPADRQQLRRHRRAPDGWSATRTTAG